MLATHFIRAPSRFDTSTLALSVDSRCVSSSSTSAPRKSSRMHERDALAMHVQLRLAVAEHARAAARRAPAPSHRRCPPPDRNDGCRLSGCARGTSRPANPAARAPSARCARCRARRRRAARPALRSLSPRRPSARRPRAARAAAASRSGTTIETWLKPVIMHDLRSLRPRAARSMRASESLSTSRSTCSVCWPSVGGARRTEAGVSLKRNGMPSIFTSPAVGCCTVRTISRAARVRIAERLRDRVDAAARNAARA